MIHNCSNCGIEYEAVTSRSRFHSPGCKLAFNRNNKPSTVSQSTVSNDTQTPKNDTQRDTQLSKTDTLFQKDAIARGLGDSWLRFSDIVCTPKCTECGKFFKTNLRLLRYCSTTCRDTA